MSLTAEFSLTSPEKALPTAIDGHPIEASFRVILRALRLLAMEDVRDEDKAAIIAGMFYTGGMPEQPMEAFMAFVRGPGVHTAASSDGAMLDFDQDSEEIYCAFLSQYGIDLMAGDMHWWRFLVLLRGLSPDSALGRKLALRSLDVSQCRDKGKAAKAKASVQLRKRKSKAQAALEDALAKGEWPSA